MAIALACANVASVASVVNSASFSTATTQTIFNDGFQTLLHFNIYETPQDVLAPTPPVYQAEPIFLTWTVGLDALQRRDVDGIPVGFVFSTAQTGTVDNGGTPITLNKGRAYYFNTLSSLIEEYAPLAGLVLENLDALAAMPDGVIDSELPARAPNNEDPHEGEPVAWAFSTATVEHVIQDGAVLTLHPGNIFCFNRLTGRIIMLAETQSFGVQNIDALDASSFADTRGADPVFLAPIAFSIDRTQFLRIGSRFVRLLSNSMYEVYPDSCGGGGRCLGGLEVEMTFDGTARRIRDLDAFTTAPRRIIFDAPGACLEDFLCTDVSSSEDCFEGNFLPFTICSSVYCIIDGVCEPFYGNLQCEDDGGTPDVCF